MENKLRIAAAIAAQTGLEADQLKDWLETPPDPAMGDYAFPCFRLAKTMRKAPPAIAAELAGSIGHIDGIASMEAKGGYLNFFADKTAFVRDTLNKVLAQGDSYGDSDLGGGRNVCVEYSSINIAKPCHRQLPLQDIQGAGLQRHRHKPPGGLGNPVRQDDSRL